MNGGEGSRAKARAVSIAPSKANLRRKWERTEKSSECEIEVCFRSTLLR